MLDEYDFSHARKNPYAKLLKKQITINIDVSPLIISRTCRLTMAFHIRLL